MIHLYRLFLFLLCAGCTAFTQNAPAPQLQPRPAAPSAQPPGGTDRQITIDVQVRDKSGTPVRGLQKQDFSILDDKQARDISAFQAVDNGTNNPDLRVEMIFVVDAVNTGTQAVAIERQELKKFLLRNGGKLTVPVSLVFFTDTGTKMQNGFSRDGNALATLYDQYETGLRSINRATGFYGATERFDLSIKALSSLTAYEATRPGRKLIVWFSPGWPLLSGPNVQLSKKEANFLFDSVVAFSGNLRKARVTLYSIDPLGMSDAGGFRTFYYKEFLKGVPSANRVLPGNIGLPVLAAQSGGLVLNSTNDLEAAIENCASDADSFYTLTFESPRADRVDEYHAILVKVDKPDVTVRTRTGYYAQP